MVCSLWFYNYVFSSQILLINGLLVIYFFVLTLICIRAGSKK